MNYLKEVMVRILNFLFFFEWFLFFNLFVSYLKKKKRKYQFFDSVLVLNDNSRVDRDKYRYRVDVVAWKRRYSSFRVRKVLTGSNSWEQGNG